MKYYAGIGSRETPKDIGLIMVEIAKVMAKKGYVLRSGGANGADTAFEMGCDQANGAKEIYVPWDGFNGIYDGISATGKEVEAEQIASQFHPAWHRCSQGARKMHSRNVYQILGKDLNTPSHGVFCWTPYGTVSGGTGQAIRIANHYNITVRNLGNAEDLAEILEWLEENN